GGRDALIEVRLTATEAAATADAQGSTVHSAPVVIASETGLHARPAAMVVATARRFPPGGRPAKEGRDAHARSRVCLLVLAGGPVLSCPWSRRERTREPRRTRS